jgi:methylamine--corrinoid protein Co-methyltransferase
MSEIQARAETGPIVDEGQFDKRILPKKIQELVKEYDVKYCPDEPIPMDDDLANRVFEAGKKLLLDTGIFCTETSRMIKFSEDEIDEALKSAPSKVTVGRGKHARQLVARKTGDKRRPWLTYGQSGMPVSEELAVPIAQSLAQEQLIEGYWSGTISELGGAMVRAHSPLEIMASRYEITSTKEALKKAGKLGLPEIGGMTGLTPEAFIAAISPGGLETGDCIITSSINELKTSFNTMSKVAYVTGCSDVNLMFDPTPVLRGIAGGPEGCALVSVAQEIECILFGADMSGATTVDIMNGTSSSRETLWPANVSIIAMNNNSDCIEYCYYFAAAGPCTEMLLYEAAVKTISAVASGYDMLHVPMASAAAKKDHISPLEFRLSSEVAHAVTGINRHDANNFVKELLKKYEHNLQNPPEGKTFTQCVDVKTLKPTAEWLEIYSSVKKELRNVGILSE